MQKPEKTSVQFLKGVGPAKKVILENLGIHSIEDLLYLFPKRYEDRRNICPIAQACVGEFQTLMGRVKLKGSRRSFYTKKHVAEVVLDDKSGRIHCVWFNQPYMINYLKDGDHIVCYGKVDMYKNRLQMVSPEYEVVGKEADSLNVKRIVPVYPLTRGISQRYLRKIIHVALEDYSDGLTDELTVGIKKKYHLDSISRCIKQIHFPDDFSLQESAMRRVSFEEFFFFQVSVFLRRKQIKSMKGYSQIITPLKFRRFKAGFPFTLTTAQIRAMNDISTDLGLVKPMMRLLQGDVGSGKTAVAVTGCLIAKHNKGQSAIMAPTELLARQHYQTIEEWCKGGPLKNLKATLLISGLKASERKKALKEIKEGKTDIIIGTHALITEDVEYHRLSYVVVDEQHRFGVAQRSKLSRKGLNPDVLIMTATPIPRTLCLTLYGDLDVSVLDELPAGRGLIKTIHVLPEKASKVYQFVAKSVHTGRQAYIVYPVIEESENHDLKSAKEMFQYLSQHELKGLNVALIHGKLKRAESEVLMSKFKAGKIDVLIATSVLEVGIDVPNAATMVIEHAERFGLAQLHQLRGRIGRGEHLSHCFLVCDPSTEEGINRIDAMLDSTDGFKIAERDLEIRGPGHYFGRHQHGLNELRVINPVKQMDMLKAARSEAEELIKSDPDLKKAGQRNILRVVKRRYPTYLELIDAG